MADDEGGRIFLVRPRAHDDGLSESQLSESVAIQAPDESFVEPAN